MLECFHLGSKNKLKIFRQRNISWETNEAYLCKISKIYGFLVLSKKNSKVYLLESPKLSALKFKKFNEILDAILCYFSKYLVSSESVCNFRIILLQERFSDYIPFISKLAI